MIDRDLIVKVLCVVLVAALMVPAGQVLYPYLAGDVSDLQFNAIEAVVSATVGFGISAIFL